jgi:hypothetical protein
MRDVGKMKNAFILLTVLTVCGCATPKKDPDILTIYAMRLHELGDVVIVPTPASIPFKGTEPSKAYLDGFADGYRSGRTGISISPFFPDDIAHRDAHVKGWYDGQSQGMRESLPNSKFDKER